MGEAQRRRVIAETNGNTIQPKSKGVDPETADALSALFSSLATTLTDWPPQFQLPIKDACNTLANEGFEPTVYKSQKGLPVILGREEITATTWKAIALYGFDGKKWRRKILNSEE